MTGPARQKHAPPQPAPTTNFGFKSAAELTSQPMPIHWAVRGLLEVDSLAELFGDPASGKSFAALELAFCVATGLPFHGHDVKQGPAIYLAGEGQRGLARRLKALEIDRQQNVTNAPLFVSSLPAGLCDGAQAADLRLAVDALLHNNAITDKPVLIVVDTVARNFGPGDENATADMSQFVASLDIYLREPYEACVLLVHHSGHAEKTRSRGSSVLKAALDAEYQIERNPDDRLIRMACTKAKDHDAPADMAFQLKSVQLPWKDDQGQPMYSAALESVGYQPPPTTGKQSRGKHQQSILATLQRMYAEQQQNLLNGGYDPNNAKVEKSLLREACSTDVSKNRFYDALRSLERNGEVTTDGPFVYLP